MENRRRNIEVFSAGCSVCHEAVELVKRIAGSSREVAVLDIHKHEVASRAKQYGVRSVPAVVIDDKMAACRAGRGVEEETIRAALELRG